MKPKDFVDKYLADAKLSEQETGTPYLVTMSQAILESGWGDHAPGNNFFGIKDTDRLPGSQYLSTHEWDGKQMVTVQQKFEVFDSPAQCFSFHGELLKRNFAPAFKYTDPIQFITAVQTECGHKYATDPNYVTLITKIIHMLQNILGESA